MQPEAGTVERTLKAAQRGDLTAFNALVLTYQRQVFNLCYRTLGNPEDAADATQDALLSAFRGLRTFNGAPAGDPGVRPAPDQTPVTAPTYPVPMTVTCIAGNSSSPRAVEYSNPRSVDDCGVFH